MAFFGSMLRARRGDFNLFLIAALVALLVLPGASHAVLPPQSCEAVLYWLHSESTAAVPATVSSATSLLSISHQKAETPQAIHADVQLSAATNHCGQFSALPVSSPLSGRHSAPRTLTLERHAVARLAGVRTNRRLI